MLKIPYISTIDFDALRDRKELMGRHGENCRGPGRCQCRAHGPAIQGFLIPCLLLLLKDEPSHGYQMTERLEGRDYFNGVPDPGVIYRHLRTMENEGLVTSHLQPGDGPARKVYTITPAGHTCLENWIRDLSGVKQGLDTFLKDTSE